MRDAGLYSMQTALARNGFIRRRRMQRRPIGISPTTQVSISTLPIRRVTFGLFACEVRHAALIEAVALQLKGGP